MEPSRPAPGYRVESGRTDLVVPESPFAVNIVGGDLDVLLIPEPVFNRVREGSASSALDLTFLGVALGAAISIVLMLVATELPESTRTTLVWALGGTVLASLYLLFRVAMTFRRQNDQVKKIKEGRRFRMPPGGIPGLPPLT